VALQTFLLTHVLFADDFSFMSNDPDHIQTMLNKLRAYERRKSLIVNTQKSEVMCFNSHTIIIVTTTSSH